MRRRTGLLKSWTMKDCAYKSVWIILPIVLFVLFSYASAEQKQIKSENAESYKSRGLAHLEKRQYDQAIMDFNKALKINPRDAHAYHNRGRAYEEKGQYDQAILSFDKVLEINPRYVDAYFNRGLVYHAKGQYDQAVSDYTKALEINSGDAGTYYARGFTYYFKKEYEKSWVDVKKAQSLGYPIHPKFLDDLLRVHERQGWGESKTLSSS
jgi:tetratricopeptide (TPR) repeat protein